MSIVDEIYNIADKVAGETVTRQGNTIVAAIDALNDALAGSDQPAAKSVTEALSLLAQTIDGKAVSYALISDENDVSINGAPAQTYKIDNPGTVSTGDVITWADGLLDHAAYYAALDSDEPIKDDPVSSPYTVEAVTGAVLLSVYKY